MRLHRCDRWSLAARAWRIRVLPAAFRCIVGRSPPAARALVATDRRTAGAQVDDEGIELKVVTRPSNLYGDRAHINVTSYNGVVLLTGEVPDQGAWASIGNFAKAQQKVHVRAERARRRAADRPCRSAQRHATSRRR